MAATSDLQLYMRYLTRFLQVGGMYVSFETKQRWRYLQCFYCIFMSLLQVANFIRLSVILLKELTLSANMMTVLATWCFALWTAYQLPAVAIASSKYMHTFVTELSSYFDRYDNEAKLGRTTKCLKRLFIVIIVFWFLLACVFMTVNLTSSPAVINSRFWYLYPFTELSGVPYYISVSACSLVVTYSSYASTAAYIFFVATARLVAKEFVQINMLVREMVDSEMVNEQCESLRKRHAHLCEMLNTGNKIVSHILFPCFTTQIPTLCFLLFGVIRGTLPPEGQTMSIYVIGAGLLNLFSTLFIGAYVTSAVSSTRYSNVCAGYYLFFICMFFQVYMNM